MDGSWRGATVRGVRAAGLIALVVLAAGVSGIYGWTARTSDEPAQRGIDPYNRLADAFVHGQTSLRLTPPPGLAALPDPSDATANAAYRFPDPAFIHDLSLHDGRFYAYWGPAPALVLFVPARLLGLGSLSLAFAVALFALLALGCSVALLRLVVRRWLPRTPDRLLVLGALALAFGNAAPFILRRPAVYEVAIASAACFTWAGLLALFSGLARERPAWGRVAVGSLALGLAFLSRPPTGIAALVAVAALAWLWRSGTVSRAAAAAALLGPFTLCVAGFGIYNALRFGSPVDFGQRYQLSDYTPSSRSALDLRRLAPGAWYYLLLPVRATLQFPFAFLDRPGSDPFAVPGFDKGEYTAGLIPCAPILLALLAGPWALRGRSRALVAIAAAGVGLGLALVAIDSALIPGATQRYEVDFASYLLVAALLSWLAAYDRVRHRRRPRRAIAWLGGAAIAITACVGLALSVNGSDARLRRSKPATFGALQRFFSPVALAGAAIVGHPVLVSVDRDASVGPRRFDGLGIDGATVALTPEIPRTLGIVAPRDSDAVLRARVGRGPGIPRAIVVKAQVTDSTGATYAVPADGRFHDVPIRVRSGVDELPVVIVASRPIPPAQPVTSGQVTLEDLRLRSR